jgi:hypothetical protein
MSVRVTRLEIAPQLQALSCNLKSSSLPRDITASSGVDALPGLTTWSLGSVSIGPRSASSWASVCHLAHHPLGG